MQDIPLVLILAMAAAHELEAAKSAQDFVKYLVVLGVGGLGFALTSLSSTEKAMLWIRIQIMVSSGMLAVSVFLGILAYGSLVSQLFHDNIDLEASPVRWQAIAQWVLFFLGIVVLGVAILMRESCGAAIPRCLEPFCNL